MKSDPTVKETKTLVFRVSHEEYERIDQAAKRFHVNRSSILRISIAKFLDDIAKGYLRVPDLQNIQESQEGSSSCIPASEVNSQPQ